MTARKICAALAAVSFSFAATGVAVAADMPIKAAAPPFSWSGCYLGAHVGYGWGRTDNRDDPSSSVFLGSPLTVYTDGFLGGGQVGCNYQWTPDLVIGLEGDISGAGIDGSTNVVATVIVPNDLGVVAHAKTDMIATATARLGYAMGHSLLYAKGGAAWAHDKYGGDWSYTGPGGPLSGSVHASQTRTGFTFGVGFEHALANNWSLKLEYNYYNFGTRAASMPITGTPLPGSPAYVGDIHPEINAVMLGLNYRFGG
jgi:outer membrane immunogenic protein